MGCYPSNAISFRTRRSPLPDIALSIAPAFSKPMAFTARLRNFSIIPPGARGRPLKSQHFYPENRFAYLCIHSYT